MGGRRRYFTRRTRHHSKTDRTEYASEIEAVYGLFAFRRHGSELMIRKAMVRKAIEIIVIFAILVIGAVMIGIARAMSQTTAGLAVLIGIAVIFGVIGWFLRRRGRKATPTQKEAD